MRESTIEKQVTAYAKANGWLCFKWTSPSNRGVPDRVFFRKGKILLVEFKATGKSPTPLQALIHERLSKQGFPVHVIDDATDIELFD